MSLRFVQSTVTIGSTSYGTLDPADRATGPCAWSPARIRWGYEDSIDDPQASTLSLRVTVTDADTPPRYGDLVRVTTRPQLRDDDDNITHTHAFDVAVFYGKIDGATRRRVNLAGPGAPAVDGWAYDLTASGPIAQARRTNLADTPWPAELNTERLDRINALMGDRFRLVNAMGFDIYTVITRDVDNFPLMEAAQRTMALRGAFITEATSGTPGIALGRLRLTKQLRPDANGHAQIVDSAALERGTVPASMFVDQERALNVQTIINSGSISYWASTAGDDERTVTRTNDESVDLYGQSQYRTDTDAALSPSVEVYISDYLTRLMTARAVETWRLDQPLEVMLARVPHTLDWNFLPLLISDPGTGVMRITDAPDDLAPIQRIIGGTLTLHGDPKQQALSLNVEPPESSIATRTIAIENLRTGLPTLRDFLISELDHVTFNDLRTVDYNN